MFLTYNIHKILSHLLFFAHLTHAKYLDVLFILGNTSKIFRCIEEILKKKNHFEYFPIKGRRSWWESP
jgi:hypothetical protein